MGTVKMKDELTEAEKLQLRVLLAKDVLKLMRAKKVEAKSMIYVDLGAKYRHSRRSGIDIQAAIEQATKPCKACLLGAAMLAFAHRHDAVTVRGRWVSRDDCALPLRRLFSDHELNALETAFEGWGESDLLEGVDDDDARLTAIMKNIIANEGVFVPSQLIKAAEVKA